MTDYHSIDIHNAHIKRFGHCKYCDSGSMTVHKTIILDKFGFYGEKI